MTDINLVSAWEADKGMRRIWADLERGFSSYNTNAMVGIAMSHAHGCCSTERDVDGHRYAHAWVREIRVRYDGTETTCPICLLYSYGLVVAAYNVATGAVLCRGLYSKTTIRHISWFAHMYSTPEYPVTYYDFKSAVASTLEKKGA